MRRVPEPLFPIVSSGPSPGGWLGFSSNGIRSPQKRNPPTTKNAFSAQLGLKLKTIFMPMLICEPLLFCCWLHRRHAVYLSTLLFFFFFSCHLQASHLHYNHSSRTRIQPDVESSCQMIFGPISHMAVDRWLHPPLSHFCLNLKLCRTAASCSRFNSIPVLLSFLVIVFFLSCFLSKLRRKFAF